jgi:UDP-N-acetyl-D-mannosaminuronic acid dehydrogenase
MKVTVVGAGGHVGLPFSLVVAEAGHDVCGYDLNDEIVFILNEGTVPYVEHGAEALLRKHLFETKRLSFTTSPRHIAESDVVAIMLGTPVDEENNPRLDSLFDFIDNILIHSMKKGVLIILRSTVSPGTTEVIRDRIEKNTGLKESEDFFLVFCPERVLQTKGIEETKNLPALVGAFSSWSYNQTVDFLQTFMNESSLFLTPREAEIAKLMTNMWRYVSFAFANEMYMIGDKHGVNIEKVIKSANYGYERMDVPLPGPNVGGPCLFKDGRFLLDSVPFADLIQVSFLINEGMPDYIWQSISKLSPKLNKVLILGAAFKKDCDDTRNSLSYKMRKVCNKHGAAAFIIDPYVMPETLMPDFSEYDAVVVMTPHTFFVEHYTPGMFGPNCVIADVWKMWELSKKTKNGIYKLGDDL